MEFLCPRCNGNAFFLHSTLDNITMAQCSQCGAATRFEESAMTGLKTVKPGASAHSPDKVRHKLHLHNKT